MASFDFGLLEKRHVRNIEVASNRHQSDVDFQLPFVRQNHRAEAQIQAAGGNSKLLGDQVVRPLVNEDRQVEREGNYQNRYEHLDHDLSVLHFFRSQKGVDLGKHGNAVRKRAGLQKNQRAGCPQHGLYLAHLQPGESCGPAMLDFPPDKQSNSNCLHYVFVQVIG